MAESTKTDEIVSLTLLEAKKIVQRMEQRLGISATAVYAPSQGQTIDPIAARQNLLFRQLIRCMQKLHPISLSVAKVNDFWNQQTLVKSFLIENSDEFADVEMCRSLPIFVYAEREIDQALLNAWIADMGFTHLALLPPLRGSWLQRMFASNSVPTTSAAFWNGIDTKASLNTLEKYHFSPLRSPS